MTDVSPLPALQRLVVGSFLALLVLCACGDGGSPVPDGDVNGPSDTMWDLEFGGDASVDPDVTDAEAREPPDVVVLPPLPVAFCWGTTRVESGVISGWTVGSAVSAGVSRSADGQTVLHAGHPIPVLLAPLDVSSE